jgi:hypothetical protein
METAPMQAAHPGATDGGNPGAAWGVTGLMDKDILPDDPAERRMRGRLRALRAMDRLGLLGEENLIPTLARRPALRWLADEGGARWSVLAELGRIGEPEAFDEATEWALERRPRPEEVRDYVRRLGDGALRSVGPGRAGRMSVKERTVTGPRLRGATAE